MKTGTINDLLRNKCGKMFIGVFAADRLPNRLPPRRPLLLVCNTDPHDRPGEHWVALYLRIHQGEYFDSYEREPPLIFRRYLDKHYSRWIMNDKKLQSVLTRFCGHYCIFYCLYKCLGYNMRNITNCFVDDVTLNDALVHKFVCGLINA